MLKLKAGPIATWICGWPGVEEVPLVVEVVVGTLELGGSVPVQGPPPITPLRHKKLEIRFRFQAVVTTQSLLPASGF